MKAKKSSLPEPFRAVGKAAKKAVTDKLTANKIQAEIRAACKEKRVET